MTPSAVRGHVVASLKGEIAIVRLCKDRIYADAAPRDAALPLVTVRRTSHRRGVISGGLSDEAVTGLHVTVLASEPTSRDDVADAVRDALESRADPASGPLLSLGIIGDADGFEWADDGGESGWWSATFDIEAMHYREAVTA